MAAEDIQILIPVSIALMESLSNRDLAARQRVGPVRPAKGTPMVKKFHRDDMRTVVSISQDRNTEWLTYFIESGHLMPRQFMQILCDLVRNAALAFDIPEQDLWAHFEQERANPEIAERLVRRETGATERHKRTRFSTH